MRAVEFLKYGHLAILVTGLGLGGMAIDPAHAQTGPGYGGGQGDYDNPNDRVVSKSAKNPYGIITTLRANPAATTAITNALKDTYGFCARIRDKSYLVDCLGERLEDITKSMSKSGDYGDARKILIDTSKKLRRVAANNKSSSAPRIRATGQINRQPVVTKPLTPVRREKVKQVNQEAANIMAEAETKLLRSAQASDRRLIAYAQMAKAVGSNKTLLRSA